MAEVVDKLPDDARGRPAHDYPWDQWLDGRVWKLTEGVDIESAKRFASTARVTAKRLGFKVATRRRGKDIYIQATKCESSS